MDFNGLCVVSLNLGGRNTNPVEFDLKGDNSEMALEAVTILRSARKALLNVQEGPRLMPSAEVALIREILSEIYEGGGACEWRARVERLLHCATWGDVIALVQENNAYFFNSLNLYTLKLKRPSVWEDPSSCIQLTTVADYLNEWRRWFRGLDRASKFWLEDAPRAAKKRGMGVATAFAGILIFDVMCVCTARCCQNAVCPRVNADYGEEEEEDREVPFSALAKFAAKLPASNLTARHTIAQKFISGAHAVLAQEARSFAEHPAVVERFFPPFCALDGFTAVFLRKASFAEATDISAVLAEKMVGRIASGAPEDSRKAWRTTASRLAAAVCRCGPHLGGFRACFVSLHCSKSEGTAAFVEALRDVLADYDADINVVGMDANCTGADASTFQSRLRKLGFDVGCQQHLQQVTVAKQRTAFQTQVEKYGEIDISHKDYIVSWASPRVRRGPTSYTPDLRTAYGVEHETKQCMRLPTTLWPFDHCGVTTTFERRVGCRETTRCSRSRSCSCALAAFVLLVLSMPLRGKERASPYEPGAWYYTSRRTFHRSGICEAAPPCGEGWLDFEASCYRTTARASYQGAMHACEELGATLASIGSEVENQFITNTLCPEGEFCYIGLQGDFAGEEHAWLSGEAVNYTRLGPARKSLLPLFPLSRRTSHQAAMLSNLPGEVSGCQAHLGVPFNQGIWNEGQALLPGVAIVVSACLLMLPRPSQQRFSTWLLRLALAKNVIGFVLRVWLMCYEDDFRRHTSIFGTAILLENLTHSVTAMLTLWLIIRRLSMLYPSRALKSIYTALVTCVVMTYVNAGLFVDNAAEVRLSAPVWAQTALTLAVLILTLMLGGLISTDLYRAWAFMSKEAAVGLSSQGSTSLAIGVRAAKFHFFSVVAATGTTVVRLAILLWTMLVLLNEDYPVLVHAPLLAFFRFLDTVTNDVCVHLLAVLNVDASVIRAKGITVEVVERASREVAQHRLSVRLLQAAPTSSEQLAELAKLEGKARAALGGEQEKEHFLILQSAVRVEATRIHRLMQCVRMRSMTMPVRYQFLIDIPVLEGQPRQHVPAQFGSDESSAAGNSYFEWLYAEAAGAQEAFFSQVRQLLSKFNSTPWPSDLGLVREELPWTIWAAGPKHVASRRLAARDDISPGDILIHRPRRARCGVARGSSALVVVLEEVSALRVRVHRSGSVSPEEVPRSELRTCNSGAVFVPGLQKKRQRCLDKIAADYEGQTAWPAAASLVDICRCTILLDDPYAIAVLVAHLRNKMQVVRLKNRFSEDVLDTRDAKELQSMFQMASTSSGRSCSKSVDTVSTSSTRCADDYQFRDISMNVEITTPAGLPFICEIQLTLSSLAVLKHADQKLYSIRRMKSPAELRKAEVFAKG